MPNAARPSRARRWPLLAAVMLTGLSLSSAPARASLDIMPIPAEVTIATGRVAVTPQFSVAWTGPDDGRLRSGIARALRRWEERTGLTFARNERAEFSAARDPAEASLVIECAAAGNLLPALGDDESYTLEIDSTRATLRAPAVVGVLHGLETLLQLLQSDADGWFLPAVSIRDQPRFPWRGLMIDVCRHWQPIEVIERNLDGMALVKLNVLHLHLSDDQGFRVESKTHPELHERGSDGRYFMQQQMREIVAYAAERGIRVVPEFDLPGHATSWVVSHPELASAPGPYAIERRWGVFDPVLDPTNEATYALLGDFLGEMAVLFPDPCFHIGGDENNGKQWNANPRIQAFIREHDLKDNAGLHAYFNRRVSAILTRHGKRLVGWDEILHPALPRDSIVHSWRGPEGLADAARRGFATLLSNGYYIDLCYPASQHYLNDPLPATMPLTPEEQKRVLGGEATMWAEWVSPETIDSRIWPRTAAIAERLWSPRDVDNVADMYRRLAIVSRRLEEAGLTHERNRPAMLRRVAGDGASEADLKNLRVFVDAVEPVKRYARGGQHQDFTQHTPLVTVADTARPESETARVFAATVGQFLAAKNRTHAAEAEELAAQLHVWQTAGLDVAEYLSSRATIARAGLPVARALADASAIGLRAVDALKRGEIKDPAWVAAQLAALDTAAQPHDAVLLPMIDAIRTLVNATTEKAALKAAIKRGVTKEVPSVGVPY